MSDFGHPVDDTMVVDARGVLALSHEPGRWKVPILRTEAARGEGVGELAEKIDEHRTLIEAKGTLEEPRAPICAARFLNRRPRACARRLETMAEAGDRWH